MAMASKLQKKRPPFELAARDSKPVSFHDDAENENTARPSSAKSIGGPRSGMAMDLRTKPIPAFVDVDIRDPRNQRQAVNSLQPVPGEEHRARSQPPPYQRAQYEQLPLTHLRNNSSSANLATIQPEVVSSGTTAETPSSRKCRSCGKHRVVTPGSSQAAAPSGSTESRIGLSNINSQSTSSHPGTGNSTCKSCGKRSSPTPPNTSQRIDKPSRSMPQTLPDAHTRSGSDGANEAISSTPLPPRSKSTRQTTKPPGMSCQSCRHCGKERRRQQGSTASQNLLGEDSSRLNKLNESWLLPPTRSHANRSISQPIIQTHVSNTDTNRRPRLSDKEAYYMTERRLPSQPPRNDLPAASTVGSIFRRISNAIRPAYTRSRTSVDRSAKKSLQTYVRLPETEPSPRPGSSYSFDESNVEMLPVASKHDVEHGARSYLPDQSTEVKSMTTHRAQVSGDLDLDVVRIDEAFGNSATSGLQRNNSVMQRAVTGSIKRFKSLRGAHQAWYRSDLAIEGLDTSYESDNVDERVHGY